MRVFLGIVFFALTFSSFSQDLIVKKDGVKIYCQIKSVDSLSIYYKKPGLKQVYQISRAGVESYQIYNEKKQDAFGNADESDPIYLPEDEKLLVGGYYGVANAVGDFGSKDLEKTSSGLANNGNAYGLVAVLKFSKFIGAKVVYHFQRNAFDNGLLEELYTNAYPGINFEVKSGNWQVNGFFGGVHFTTPFKTNKRLFADLDIMGGLPKCHMPELTIIASANGRSVSETQESAVKSAPAFMPGLGLRYYAFDKVVVGFNMNYLATKVTFGDVSVSNTLGYRGLAKVTQKITTFNAQFSVLILLD